MNVYFVQNNKNADIKYREEFKYYEDRFVKNYERYEQQLDELEKRAQAERPTRTEREDIKQLQKNIDYMKENKERIIIDLVANTVTLNENKRIVENIISGKDGIFDSNYMTQFEKLTQHNAASRQAFLIVGGAASGKGSVTEAVKAEQNDRCDVLEINPDLYKKLLLPFEDVKDHIELHGSLTHAESSIIFDSIAARWQKRALDGNAPDILMDVARAGKIVCELQDFALLQQNMGEKNALDFIVGMKQNDVQIKTNAETLILLEKYQQKDKDTENTIRLSNIDVNCEKYAELLGNLVKEGMRVGKTENAYLYDFSNDPVLQDKKITIGTRNLDIISQEAAMQSYNEYDPSQEAKRQKVLVIDAKVYNTPEKRAQLINRMRMKLRVTGKFEAEGIYMNERRKLMDDYVFNNSGKAEIQVAAPNPDAVRVAYKISDKAVKIPVQWGEYAIEKDGSIVVREKDMSQLKTALSNYQKDHNPRHLLETDGRAKIDVYGTDPFFIEDNYSNVYSDTKFQETLNKLLKEGKMFEAKNSTKYDDVLAYQIQKEDKVVMPDGTLLKEGDWFCVPKDKVATVEEQQDKNEKITDVYSIKQNTMQKSYNMKQIENYNTTGHTR